MERQPKFSIGQQFVTRGKHPNLCTVTDILRTYNSAGELVHFRYVATHELAGQTVIDRDVVEATIAMCRAEEQSAQLRSWGVSAA